MTMDCRDTAPATPLMFLPVADVGRVPILIAPAPLPERNQPLLRHVDSREELVEENAARRQLKRNLVQDALPWPSLGDGKAVKRMVSKEKPLPRRARPVVPSLHAMNERVAAARSVYETPSVSSAAKTKKQTAKETRRLRTPPSRVALDPLDRIRHQQQRTTQQHDALTKAVGTRIDAVSRALPIPFLLERANGRAFAERVLLLAMDRAFQAHYTRVTRIAWHVWKKRTFTLRVLEDHKRKLFLARQTSLAHACAIVQRHLLHRSSVILVRWRDSTAKLRWLEHMHCAKRIQKCWRAWRIQQKLKTLAMAFRERVRHQSAVCIQSAVRRFLGRCEIVRIVWVQRRHVAAVTIQHAYRTYVVLQIAKRYQQEVATTTIQRVWRGRLGRRCVDRRRGTCRAEASRIVEVLWLPVAIANAMDKHACANRIQRLWRACRYRQHMDSGVRRAYQRRHFSPACCIQQAWSSYRSHAVRIVVENVVFRVVITHMAAARRIQNCFRTHWKKKTAAAVWTLARLFRRFAVRRQLIESNLLPWIREWQSAFLVRWWVACGGMGAADSKWRLPLAVLLDSISEFYEDQSSPLRRLHLGAGIRLVRQLKRFHQTFLTARARQIQLAWRWHRLQILVMQLRAALVRLRRTIPVLYRQHKRRRQRHRVLQRWKRQRYIELHTRFDMWKRQYLVRIQARDLVTTTRNVRKALWFHHHKLRQVMMQRWTRLVHHRRNKRRKLNAAIMHANLSAMNSAWRSWRDEALPEMCCTNRLHELAMSLTVWKTWIGFVKRKQLSKKARKHRHHWLIATALGGWKQDRVDFMQELDTADSYYCFHSRRRAFLRLHGFTVKAKQVRSFCKVKLQAYGVRHWLESVHDTKRDRANESAACMFRKYHLARLSWTQWTRYYRHQLLQEEKLRAMEEYYERRRARTVISTWNQEFVPTWKDYRLIVSVAASYRSRTLKERYFRRGFRVFWELTAGARRVAMAVRIQRLVRSKRARERILIMRLKIRYQLETRARMGIDTRAFTAAALQAALASHEWVFVLFSMPWAPLPARTKEAFCKTASTWSFIRQQGRRMVFGLADATEILSSPVHNLSLMSWFGLQPDQLPCAVGFWQGVGPSSSSSTDSVCRLATGEIRQLRRRFKAICDVDSTSTLALVWPAQTKDGIPPPAMSHLVRWIERLQQASQEATAVDLQSYIRGFLARRRTKRYRVITMHRRRQRVRSWCRELLSRWTDRKRQHASMVLQVWVRHVHARRKFWTAFRLEVHLRKEATHLIQRSAVVYLARLRIRRALVSLLATPQRYPNAPLCQVCLVDSRALARLHCHDCQQVYCAQCYAKTHRSGKRLLHLCGSIDFVAFNEPSTSLCKACEVRMSTRVCLTCGHEEALCTSCFEAKHTDEVSSDNLKENQGRRRPRRVWWSSVKFREHDWKRVNLQDSPCLNALTVMERYAWQSSDMVVRKLHEAAQVEESIREREDRLLAIRVQQESILRDAFDRYDTDKSGAIDRSEFKRMFKEELCEPLSDALVDDAMKRMDKSGNGLVEFDELLAWFAEDALAKEESSANQQADSRSLSMLKDALRAKRQMRRYKEKLNEFVPTVRVPKPQILAEALLSQLTEKNTQKKRTVPGFPSVVCLEHADFARKRKVFYRFVKEICGLDWIDEDEPTIPIANAMHVFDESFVPRWNAGELTYDFYFDDESFEFEGELWQRKWIPDTKKYVFTTARRKTRKVDAHTANRKRRKRFSLTRNATDSHGALPELTEIEETVEIIEQVDPRRKQMLLEEAQEAFKKADRDGSGYIDEHEFHRVLVLELCEPISKTKAKQIMKQLDADGSGKIDFHEFFQWYAVEKCQEYPMTPQMARARALLQTRRRAKATAAAAVHAGISGGLQLKEAVARKRKEQQLARDCKGAPPELIALLQEGFGKLLAEKALALHNQDVAFARKWLVDRKEQEELERVQAARARADTKARAKKMACEKKLKRRQRITTLRKQLKVLIIGPSKKEAHAARMQQALSNLDREIQLVERQLAQ